VNNRVDTSTEIYANIPSILSKISFFLFLTFVIFGTSSPYREVLDVEDIVTANPRNQILFSSLYFLSIIAILPKANLIFKFIKKEKFLCFFILWSLLSVFWSDHTFVSFKRWVQLTGTIVILLAAIIHFSSVDDAIRYFQLIFYIYMPLNLLAVLFIPDAIQWHFPAWRGLTDHKNHLGQISLMSLIFWVYSFYQGNMKNRAIAVFYVCLSLILLLGSRSATAILTTGILFFILGFEVAFKRIFRTVIGSSLSSLLFVAFFICLIPIFYLGMDYIGFMPELFGKDLTFSGRTDLWASIFDEAKTHLLYGCGFGGFWVVGSAPIESLYNLHVWLPKQAHLGYLDTINETGIIGLAIVALMVICYFIYLLKFESPHFWKWFVIAALVLNTMESCLMSSSRNITGILFLYSYLALFYEAMKRSEEQL
jgi:O-antigen ligase